MIVSEDALEVAEDPLTAVVTVADAAGVVSPAAAAAANVEVG